MPEEKPNDFSSRKTMKGHYSDDLISSLLENDLFIRWVMYPSPELDAFWEKEIEGNHELKGNIRILRRIIKNAKIEEPRLTPNDKKIIWEKIEHRVKPVRREGFRPRIWMQVASAAAVVLFVAGGYFYISGGKTAEIDYASLLDSGTSWSGEENISLVLSDSKRIDIKSSSSSVVYDNKGSINVDSEEIEAGSTGQSSLNQLLVPYGRTTSLTLGDGTRIWVNAGSKLIYPSVFSGGKREIYLDGEVFLDVAKDRNNPFIIKTNHLDIHVLGTKLNVSAYNDDQEQSVVLVNGEVQVKNKGIKQNHNLRPDQMLTYGVSSNKVDIGRVDTNDYVSWIHGYLLFRSENLSKVLQKLERHYSQRFVYNEADIGRIRVSGKLDMKGGVEDALKYISITAPVKHTKEEDNIRIELIDGNH